MSFLEPKVLEYLTEDNVKKSKLRHLWQVDKRSYSCLGEIGWALGNTSKRFIMSRPMTAILVSSHRASVLLQVKWSDSSSTAVTKTHRELEDFLLKVSIETGLWCCISCSFSLVDLMHMPVCRPVGQDATWPDQQGTSICFVSISLSLALFETEH